MKSMSRKTFRVLVLLSWVIGLACVALWFVEMRHLPPELSSYQDALANEPLGAADFVLLGVLLLGFVLGAVASVGLYGFRSWGRPLYLFSVVSALVPLPPYEPFIGSTLSTSAAYITLVLSGFILALVYYSPLSRYFEPKGSDTPWQT